MERNGTILSKRKIWGFDILIFISVGTHKQQFDRLLKAVDELIAKKVITQNVFAQTGHSKYKPKRFKGKRFLGLEEFDEKIKKCSLFITHAGEGNIGTALQLEKKMIVVPRRKKFDEHTNDHQLELADAIKKQKQAIVIANVSELENAIKDAKKIKMKKTNHAKGIIAQLDNFMAGLNG
jgi:UDP-N-acetylglucosamine transferase subunit ALG13